VTEEGRQHGELPSRRAAEFNPRESAAGLRSLATAGAGSIDPGLAVEVGGVRWYESCRGLYRSRTIGLSNS
jgi:hypothetical protein